MTCEEHNTLTVKDAVNQPKNSMYGATSSWKSTSAFRNMNGLIVQTVQYNHAYLERTQVVLRTIALSSDHNSITSISYKSQTRQRGRTWKTRAAKAKLNLRSEGQHTTRVTAFNLAYIGAILSIQADWRMQTHCILIRSC